MLLKKELIESMDKQYEPMLKLVNIVDFTKCIAQFAGLKVDEVSDDSIKEYLRIWAINKYKYFNMLGNSLTSDIPIEYEQFDDNKEDEFELIKKQFPGFLYWLDMFKHTNKNKIDLYDLHWSEKDTILDLFPNENIDNTSITHFFKRQLQAPDELVTAIGRIYENDKIKGTYTISIDPVDMMLASENPYNWNSCYRLTVPNESSHADGCLAAILDDSSLITYIWDKEGKFILYGKYTLKNVRWKRIRRWISISPEMSAIHFNDIYPGKDCYPKEFCQKLRAIVEEVVCNYTHKDNLWNKNIHSCCSREYPYGYGEYDENNIYTLKENEEGEDWNVFNHSIVCPCGCGSHIPGSDWDEEDDYDEDSWEYNGNGFTYEHFYERDKQYWCDYAEDYCSHPCSRYECEGIGCCCWDDAHPVCKLDMDKLCEDFEYNWTPLEVEDGVVTPEENHCHECPLYKLHCHKDIENESEIANSQKISMVDKIEDNKIYMTTTNWQTNSASDEMFKQAMILEQMQTAEEEARTSAEASLLRQMKEAYSHIFYGDGRDK